MFISKPKLKKPLKPAPKPPARKFSETMAKPKSSKSKPKTSETMAKPKSSKSKPKTSETMAKLKTSSQTKRKKNNRPSNTNSLRIPPY